MNQKQVKTQRNIQNKLLLAMLATGACLFEPQPIGIEKMTDAEAVKLMDKIDQVSRTTMLPPMTKFDLLGYCTPTNGSHRTVFFNCWSKGGTLIIHEADRSDRKAMLILEQAIALGKCDFGVAGLGMVKRNENCRIILETTTNTIEV